MRIRDEYCRFFMASTSWVPHHLPTIKLHASFPNVGVCFVSRQATSVAHSITKVTLFSARP